MKLQLKIFPGLRYFPGLSPWVFLVCILILSLIYQYDSILFKPPQSLHLWRQADCLSLTLNYFQDQRPFLEPAIHNLGGDGTGKTISEFPLIYYGIAQIWKQTGQNVLIYRLLVLLLYFTGLFALFYATEKILRDSFLAIFVLLLLFTSPVQVYYANNFLMNMPAFALAMIGLSFFLLFVLRKQNKYLYGSVLLYALAGLLKITSLLSFAAIIGIFVLELILGKMHPDRKVFKNPWITAVLFSGVIGLQVLWYLYARRYNIQFNGGVFLIGILPVWGLDRIELNATIEAIGEHMRWNYFRRETLILSVLLLGMIFLFYKRLPRLIFHLIWITTLGFLTYVILFFGALRDHDYYTVNLFILFPLIWIGFLLILKDRFSGVFNSLVFRILLVAFLVHNVDFARRRITGRYEAKNWQNQDYVENLKTFTEIAPYLRSLGIDKEDRVISISDESINISLYLMNQKGWTNFNLRSDPDKIIEKMEQGALYMLVYKQETLLDPQLQPFLKNKIGEFGQVKVYKL